MPDDCSAQVIVAPFAGSSGERYLCCASSTITARSLPDVRDGPKPMHRRLLYAMRALRLGAVPVVGMGLLLAFRLFP